MYLLYVDESGDLSNPDAEHVVLGGVAVHESDARRLSREVDAVMARHLEPHLRDIELHSQHIRGGKGPWRRIPRQTKTSIMTDVGGLLASFPASQPFALFSVVREPGAVAHTDAIERIYEELAMRFDAWIRKNRVADVPQYGMFVADEAKYEKIVQPLVDKWRGRRGGTARFGPLRRIVEVPLFVDSKASRLIQLGDFVAHAVYVSYEENHHELLGAISPAFARRPNGMIDGLMHLCGDTAACPCIACANRREPRPVSLPGLD